MYKVHSLVQSPPTQPTKRRTAIYVGRLLFPLSLASTPCTTFQRRLKAKKWILFGTNLEASTEKQAERLRLPHKVRQNASFRLEPCSRKQTNDFGQVTYRIRLARCSFTMPDLQRTPDALHHALAARALLRLRRRRSVTESRKRTVEAQQLKLLLAAVIQPVTKAAFCRNCQTTIQT